MKRILLFCVMCLLAGPVIAETCNGGTVVTAHSATDEGCTADTCNGHEFCKSNVSMNWWSAWAWCESQQRQLAEISLMCPNTSGNACPNLNQPTGATSDYVWSKNPSDDDSFFVNLATGLIYKTTRTYNLAYAFCK